MLNEKLVWSDKMLFVKDKLKNQFVKPLSSKDAMKVSMG